VLRQRSRSKIFFENGIGKWEPLSPTAISPHTIIAARRAAPTFSSLMTGMAPHARRPPARSCQQHLTNPDPQSHKRRSNWAVCHSGERRHPGKNRHGNLQIGGFDSPPWMRRCGLWRSLSAGGATGSCENLQPTCRRSLGDTQCELIESLHSKHPSHHPSAAERHFPSSSEEWSPRQPQEMSKHRFSPRAPGDVLWRE
jgi:hypothetical protein